MYVKIFLKKNLNVLCNHATNFSPESHKNALKNSYLKHLKSCLKILEPIHALQQIIDQEKYDIDQWTYKSLDDFVELLFIKADTIDKVIYLILYCNSRFGT